MLRVQNYVLAIRYARYLNGANVYLKSHLNCSNFRAKYWPGFQFNPELDSRAESCKKNREMVSVCQSA